MKLASSRVHQNCRKSTRSYLRVSYSDSSCFLSIVGVGFASKYAELDGMPGWPGNGAPTWGYHGDDGDIFGHGQQNQGTSYSEVYGLGDTVGCGVDFTNGTIFYTKNGTLLRENFNFLVR